MELVLVKRKFYKLYRKFSIKRPNRKSRTEGDTRQEFTGNAIERVASANGIDINFILEI
jgi:hypothetical protein